MKYLDHKKEIERQAKAMGLEMTTLGNPHAPLMLVGWQMYYGEKFPYCDPRSAPAVQLLQQMAVPKEAVYLTNLLRLPPTEDVIVPENVVDNSWSEFLLAEIKENCPKAVVLMGLPLAHKALGITEQKMEDVRYRRFVWPKRFNSTSFFVTHDPSVCLSNRKPLMTVAGTEFIADIQAIAETDQDYFPTIKPIGGFSGESK